MLLVKSAKINFVQFLMFFYEITEIGKLIMKPIFTQKQRKLSHLICISGHHYLLKEVLRQIDLYHHHCLNRNMQS